jgi:PIN domain nuclease of toxin-antitoxin system
MRYLIDSYAWLEYFMGTRRRVKEIVESADAECVVSAISPTEAYAKSIKTDGVES